MNTDRRSFLRKACALTGAGWLATRERFRDPGTQRIMRVWVDPASGERHYVPDDD